MRYIIPLIITILILFSHTASSQTKIDLDKDGIPDVIDRRPFDYDNDGMPDEWEKAHGLNPEVNDAELDNNGDGISNLEEYKETIRKKSFESQLKDIPLEKILLISLVIGGFFIVIGVILHLKGKRKAKIIAPHQAPYRRTYPARPVPPRTHMNRRPANRRYTPLQPR